MPAMAQVPKDHPLMLAWEAHKQTEEYANSRKWAMNSQHVDGSLWALFEAGWRAAHLTQPAQAVDGWQPIETAPKDGTAVLVMRNLWPGCPNGVAESCNGHNTYVAEFWSEMGVSGAWICYMDQVSEPRCPVEPTHWRPLPTPPAALAKHTHQEKP